MTLKLELGVYRRLDNRFEDLPDDSPRGLELHIRRRDALHAALDNAPGLRVTNWGETDDQRSHEYVKLVVEAVVGVLATYPVLPGLIWLGKKLAEKSVETAVSEAVKRLYARLFDKQKSKEILDYSIALPGGIRVDVDPMDRQAKIFVTFKDGKVESFKYIRSRSKKSLLSG